MSNGPDEENSLEHFLDQFLLEQRHVRIHPRHIDVNLAIRVLLDFVPAIYMEVLLDELLVVGSFPLQHGVPPFQAGREISRQ